MELWCNHIHEPIDDNSSWRASIYMPSTLFTISDITGVPLDQVQLSNLKSVATINQNDIKNVNDSSCKKQQTIL